MSVDQVFSHQVGRMDQGKFGVEIQFPIIADKCVANKLA